MRCSSCGFDAADESAYCTACGSPFPLVRRAPVEKPPGSKVDLVAALVTVAAAAGLLLVVLVPQLISPTVKLSARAINLREAEMPGWFLAFDADAGFQRPGLVDQSGRSFVKGDPGSSGLIVGSQVLVFGDRAGAERFFDENLALFQSQLETLEIPMTPAIGERSLYRGEARNLWFTKANVVVSMQFTIYGASFPFSKSDLADLAFIVEARIR